MDKKDNQLKQDTMLHAFKFTAKNAHYALTTPWQGVSGLCCPEFPWGEQCTAFLPDGTPVERSAFVTATLAKLAGDVGPMGDLLLAWHQRMNYLSKAEG